jgi:photosystem II stability/assembly factor-like uncharacterized protein
MKRLILFELILLFLSTTFIGDNPPGWFQQTLPVNDLVNDIFFIDSLTGWVVTDGRTSTNDTGYIFTTINGGNNWTIQYNQPMRLTAVQFLDINTGYVAGGSGSGTGRLFKTTNSGVNWFQTSGNLLGLGDLDDEYFVNKDTGWVCDAQTFGGVLKTINGGNSWVPQLSDTARPNKLFFINKDTGWVGSNEANGRLFRTTNGGVNWNLQYTFSTNPVSFYFLNGSIGWIGGAGTGNGIQYTTNGGSNWINSQGYTGGGYDVKFINDSIGYTGRAPEVLKSTDGGKNWGYQITPLNTYRSIAIIRNDSLNAWAGTFSIIHTTDGGGPINYLGVHQLSNEMPNEYKLFQNYPNPFNPKTYIKYQISKEVKSQKSKVKIVIYDITGKEVTTLVNQKQNAGIYEVDFEPVGLSSGIYFYTLIADGKLIDTKRMVLIK